MSKNKDIRCTVESCHYWGQGNYCEAEQILITANSIASDTPHTYNAVQASTMPHVHVGECQETCCKTFIEKGKPDAQADGVKKK